MQLIATLRLCRNAILLAVVAGSFVAAKHAHAEDRVEASTVWYQEARKGNQGGLTVIHPQVSASIDAGSHTTVSANYSADVVTGATASVYAVDAITSATKFSDLRNSGALGLSFYGKRSRLTLGGNLGVERDYLSRGISAEAAVDLPGKNTNLALAYNYNSDQVCDRDHGQATPLERRALTKADVCNKKNGVLGKNTAGTTRWQDLEINTASLTVTQNLTPTINLQVVLYGQILRGLQSNPYRRVRIGPNEPQENIPTSRSRVSLSVRFNKFLPKISSALHVDGRYYSDTWGVNSGSAEFAYSKNIGESILVRLRGRFSQQTAATFFKDAFFYETESTAGAYFTGDRELAPVQNVVVGGKISLVSAAEDKKVLGVFERFLFHVKGDMYRFRQLDADDPAANPMGTGKQFLIGGNLIDAVAIALGVSGQF